MEKDRLLFSDLLALRTRAEVRAAVLTGGVTVSLPEAQQLVTHLESIEPARHLLRLGVVHTYTSELLDPWLSFAAALHGLELQTYHAPYGTTVQEAQENAGLLKHAPDVTLLMLRREDLHPHLARPLASFNAAQQAELQDVLLERLAAIVGQFRRHDIGHIVLTFLPALRSPGLGLIDAQAERSEAVWWARVKADIGRFIRDSVKSALFLDFDELLQQVGRSAFFDFRLWYLTRFPFSPAAARAVALRVISIGAVIKLPKAKVIALDADNTLWGGIVGEDGIDGIAVGPDYPGNAFLDFQRRILDFQQRGFILALCSKNNPADVEQVLKNHPHQLLRDEHFAARRVNWLPKPDNLISLAEELNLGLDSFIFVDDSEHECAAVRMRLPQVEVIRTPLRPIDLPGTLDSVVRLEVLSLTAEDLSKTEMYAQERRRREMKEQLAGRGGDLHDYLRSLGMIMEVSLNNGSHLARLSQLTQKTNQLNLTTRRYTEHHVQEFITSPSYLVADFSLLDIFGNSGVAGLAIIHFIDDRQAELDTFLMSCRVIGREAESAFLHFLLRQLLERGITGLVADYLPTAKNELLKEFLPSQGFARGADQRYRWDLTSQPPQMESVFPIAIQWQA